MIVVTRYLLLVALQFWPDIKTLFDFTPSYRGTISGPKGPGTFVFRMMAKPQPP